MRAGLSDTVFARRVHVRLTNSCVYLGACMVVYVSMLFVCMCMLCARGLYTCMCIFLCMYGRECSYDD